jgi:hypothetical protein
MAEQTQIEIHVLVGEDGEFVVGKDADALVDLFIDEHGTMPSANSLYAVRLTVPTPAATLITAAVGKTGELIEIEVK